MNKKNINQDNQGNQDETNLTKEMTAASDQIQDFLRKKRQVRKSKQAIDIIESGIVRNPAVNDEAKAALSFFISTVTEENKKLRSALDIALSDED